MVLNSLLWNKQRFGLLTACGSVQHLTAVIPTSNQVNANAANMCSGDNFSTTDLKTLKRCERDSVSSLMSHNRDNQEVETLPEAPRWSALKGCCKDGTGVEEWGGSSFDVVVTKKNLLCFNISELKEGWFSFSAGLFMAHIWIDSKEKEIWCSCEETDFMNSVVSPYHERITPQIFLLSVSESHFPYILPRWPVVCCRQTKPQAE